MMMKTTHIVKLLALAMIFLAGGVQAKEKKGVEEKPVASNKRLKERCENASANSDLDVNNVRARIMNGGDLWWDLVGNPRYEIPKVPDGSNEARRHSLFAGSIWIGGLFNGNIHTAAQTYRQFGGNDMWPGPVDTTNTTVDDTDCETWDNIFQVTREEIDKFVAEFEESGTVAEIPRNIREWPGNGRSGENEARFMAPYVNVGGGPGYDPTAGDYPDVKGDKALWFVYNDVGNLKTETSSPEIGLEFRTMAFAFATNDEINNMTFYETTIYNRGQKQLDSTYFGQWVDADLGYAFDDYVGCDVERGLGICFNGDNFDEGAFGYGTNPPSVGVDFFQGPVADLEVKFPGEIGDGIDNDGDGEIDEMDTTYYAYYRARGMELPIIYEGDAIDNNRDGQVDEPGEDIIMSKFVYYNNDFTTIGNPRNFNDFYNYLTGRWKNGDCIRFGGNGFTSATGGCTDFMFPDDPRDPDGWSEISSNNQPADRRFLQSAGPFTLKPGAVNQVTVGVVWARASSGGNTGSYDLLLLADDKAQKLFNNNFELLDGPDAPELLPVELDREIVLMMDREMYVETEEYEESEVTSSGNEVLYSFQGYQLYQLKNTQVSADQIDNPDLARPVWQADLKDGIGLLVNQEFDPTVSASIPKIKVDGSDEGISHVIHLTDDAFASGNSKLVNNQTYHYMLIAYASADAESANEDRQYLAGRRIINISVTPHKTEMLYGGVELQAEIGTGPQITRVEGLGNGGVSLDLTDSTVDVILEKGSTPTPTYKEGAGPVEIEVINPLTVPNANFELRFIDSAVAGTNREKLLADLSDLEGDFEEGKADYQLQLVDVANAESAKNEAEAELLESEDSLARVEAALNSGELSESDSTLYAAAKILLEDQIDLYQSDTASANEEYRRQVRRLGNIENRFVDAREDLEEGIDKARKVIWRLTKVDADGTETVVEAEKGLFTDNEMVIDEWGISIKAGPEYGPGESSEDANNGFIEGEVIYEDNAIEWLSALPQSENTSDQQPFPFDWIRAGSNFPQGSDPALPAIHDAQGVNGTHLDDQGVYKGIADGLIAPYVLTSRSVELNGVSTYGINQSSSYGLGTNNFSITPSIDLVYTADRSKWSRVLVVEMGEDPNRTEGGADKFMIREHASLELEPGPDGEPQYDNSSKGFSWFPGYAINVETGERLNIIIGENSLLNNEYSKDMVWNPTSQLTNNNIPFTVDGGLVAGGMHYVYVMGTETEFNLGLPGGETYAQAYDGCASYAKYLDPGSSQSSLITVQGIWASAAWVNPAMLAPNFKLKSWKDGLVPTNTRIRVRVNRAYQTYATQENPENGNMPFYRFNTGTIAPLKSDAFGTNALDEIRVVPNPYYAQSSYERLQLDNFVKITNLPAKCTIRIYTVNGQLVRKIVKDETEENHNTEYLWNLKNDAEVPISSGAYVINIDAYDLGIKNVKFMAIIRPVDLDTF